MRAILVSVNYSDLLSITLPYNQHHFDEITIVTSPEDKKTQEIAEQYDCRLFITDLFFRDGAVFNKFRALEAGLDVMGRWGLLTIMDADILLPKIAPLEQVVQVGRLVSPLRRMCTDFEIPFVIPDENKWKGYPVHRNHQEHAGYFQLFYANDPVLGDAPWHQIDWSHAGGADSFFQQKWHPDKKVRPSWDVLHIGDAGCNWMGRASKDIVTGETPLDADKKKQAYLDIWPQRRKRQAQGLDPFEPEKLK